MGGGIEDSPVMKAPGIVESIEPGFLNHDDIPVGRVSSVEYVLMSIV